MRGPLSGWRLSEAYGVAMVTKLIVDRFKSIRSAALEFGRVNLFIGGNGAGKSNILEAIGVLSAAAYRGLGDSDLVRKGVRITPPALMKSAFKYYELPKTLQLTAEIESIVTYKINLTGKDDDPLLAFFTESCMYEGRKMFGQGRNGVQVLGESIYGDLYVDRSMWDQVRTGHKFPAPVRQAFHVLSEFAIYSPQTDFLHGMQTGTVDIKPVGLHGEGLPQAVRGLIRQIEQLQESESDPRSGPQQGSSWRLKRKALDLAYLPRWASGVRVGRIDTHLVSRALLDPGEDTVYFLDRFMHSKRRTLSVYDSSEGTLFLLFIAVLLSHDESPKIFALDNVDSALNPRMTRALLETVIETTRRAFSHDLPCGPRQVFLTSHNPTSLDAFDLFDDDQRVFVVERDDMGHTVVNRLRPSPEMSRDDWEEAKNGRNLSQLWLDGEIRGALGQSV